MATRRYPLKRERLSFVPKLSHADLGVATPAALPRAVDLRPKLPAAYDQGSLGSCTANALVAAFQHDDATGYYGSRLFLYYNERKLDGDVPEDAGSTLSEGVNALCKYGLASEALWPYVVAQFATKPPAASYTQALAHKAVVASHVAQTPAAIKAALAAGKLVVAGIQVYASFESDAVAATGVVPMPASTEELLGGHAVALVGYDDAAGHWIVRNSWGPAWGAHGYFYLPYAYLTDENLASDLWVITKVSA